MRQDQGKYVAVDGIEATQAIQFYHSQQHLDAMTAEPDHSVPLVAGKPLGLRVYPDIQFPSKPAGHLPVQAELRFRFEDEGEWCCSEPLPGLVTARPADLIDRGQSGQTVNYCVDVPDAVRSISVRARVRVNIGAEEYVSDWREESYSFLTSSALRLRLYRIHYRGHGLDLTPPSIADVLRTVEFLRKVCPAHIDVLSIDTIEFSGDFSDATPTHCGRGWGELLALLWRLRLANTSSAVHYAILPDEVPHTEFNGYASPLGVGASIVGQGSTMAQEVGHILQLLHAPGGAALDPDPKYPVYGSYALGSIGEFGFDPESGQVFSPLECRDFMGYGDEHWVSPFTYRALFKVLSEPLVAAEVSESPYLHLAYRIFGDHQFELQSSLCLVAPPAGGRGEETAFRLEFWDDERNLLARHPVPCHARFRDIGEDYIVQSLPRPDRAAQLVFRCCQRHKPVEFDLTEEPWQVELILPDVNSGDVVEGTIDLRWNITRGQPGEVAFHLRYTNNGGDNWQAINLGFDWGMCQVDVDSLAGGDDCRFQLIANTGLQTVVVESVSFCVANKPRQAVIVSPVSGQQLSSRSTILRGVAYSPDGFAADDELEWASDRQGTLGYGSQLLARHLKAGKHVITLAAPDGLGGESQASSTIHVGLAIADH